MRYRGHLDNISNNMLIGAVNAFNKQTNFVKNQLTDQYDAVPKVQREYKANGIWSMVVWILLLTGDLSRDYNGCCLIDW